MIRRKQLITGITFFALLSAFATILADAPRWVSAVLAFIAAAASAYALASRKAG